MTDNLKGQPAAKLTTVDPQLRSILNHIVEKTDQARLVELYYWTQEPGLLEVIRAIAAMPASTREALESFFALAGDAQSIVANWESSGGLSLKSQALGEALEVMGYFLSNPADAYQRSEPN